VKTSRPIKVLQIIDSLGMGGAETWLMEVLRLWSETHACYIDFLATSGNPQIFDEEAHQLGARVHYLRFGRAHMPRFAVEFRRMLREGQYDAIHDHQDYISGWHFLMGEGLLPAVRVTHVHNPSYQILNNYGVTPMRRLTARAGKSFVARYATHITGTSRQIISEYGFDMPSFRKIPKAALYCGFDTTRFLGESPAAKEIVCPEFDWPRDAKIILFAGRIDESVNLGHPRNHKNSAFAVLVGIECCRRDSRVRMLLAGAKSTAIPILEQLIAASGLEGRIQFVGIRQDIERLMLASDALLFPSRGEGLGMVAVEAQAAGLPVLASTQVPLECLVVQDLVRFKEMADGVEAWADDLLHLMTRPRNVSGANRRVSESAFSIKNSARALLQLYEGTLE
jgi:glycosyltransferase EpsF